MTMKNLRLLSLVLLASILVFGSSIYAVADEPQLLKDIPLEWRPTDDVRSLKAIDLSVFQNTHFMISPFNDLRKKPTEIGVNIERRLSSQELLVTTKDNVASWVTYYFSKTFSDFDMNVVKEKGNLTLEADIMKFFVTEQSIYKGQVALKVRLLSKTKAVIWEEMVSGESVRFGKSYSATNYYEALSNALISAVHLLLKNDAFKNAVQKGK
jgi:hypothetical protein